MRRFGSSMVLLFGSGSNLLVSVVDFNGLNGCMRLDRIMEGLRSCGYCVCVGFVSYGSVTSDSSGDRLLFLILSLFVFWLLMQVVCSL